MLCAAAFTGVGSTPTSGRNGSGFVRFCLSPDGNGHFFSPISAYAEKFFQDKRLMVGKNNYFDVMNVNISISAEAGGMLQPVVFAGCGKSCTDEAAQFLLNVPGVKGFARLFMVEAEAVIAVVAVKQ